MTEESTGSAHPTHHASHAPSGVSRAAGGGPISGPYAIAIALAVGLLIILGTVWMANESFNGAVEQAKNTYVAQAAGKGNANAGAGASGSGNSGAGSNAGAGNGGTNAGTGTAGSQALPEIDLSKRPYRGSDNPQVVIYEISDFQCPYCQEAHPTINRVMAKYNDSVKLIFVHFPLTSIHPLAQKAAEATECANDQGKFWEMQDKLFETKRLDVPSLKVHAKAIGLDTAKFDQCLDSGEKAPLIEAFVQLCTDAGIDSTPTFILNGQQMGDRSFEAFETQIQAVLNPPRAQINTSGRPTWGNASAPVHIVEFSDFECPYCEQAYNTLKGLEAKYPQDVKVTFMHYPLSFHPNAQKAAEAAECANDQGKFWEYHDKLFTDRQLDVASLKRQAKELGLDSAKFDACLDGGAKAAQVAADAKAGTAVGVTGTPGFFINGLQVANWPNMESVILRERARVQNQAGAP